MEGCEQIRDDALFDVLTEGSPSQSSYQSNATMAETMGEIRIMLLHQVVPGL